MIAGLQGTVSGRVSSDGRLIAADPRLLDLQRQAGGDLGSELLVPQLVAIARLAQNLGILVSRNIVAADGENDLDLIVRAKPEGADVTLDIGGWGTQTSARRRFGFEPTTQSSEILWETDQSLRFLRFAGDGSAPAREGQSLEDVFRLDHDADGRMPIIHGLANRSAFYGQMAKFASDENISFILSGLPVFDGSHNFSGWRGRATPLVARPMETALHAPSNDVVVTKPSVGPNGYAHQLNAALRPPLERIVTQADSIGNSIDGAIERHYIDYAHDIAAAGRHLLGLVNDLTDVQTIESSEFKTEDDVVDLADLARRAANLLRVRASDRHVRIDAPAPDEHMPARGDFRRILQILVNLIGNAVRYSPAGSVVWVRTEHEAGIAALIVADQGKGIQSDAHERIFEKFARLDTNEPGGTGLGLYISRTLARAMGGDISVDSAAGQGARFVLTLPSATQIAG